VFTWTASHNPKFAAAQAIASIPMPSSPSITVVDVIASVKQSASTAQDKFTVKAVLPLQLLPAETRLLNLKGVAQDLIISDGSGFVTVSVQNSECVSWSHDKNIVHLQPVKLGATTVVAKDRCLPKAGTAIAQVTVIGIREVVLSGVQVLQTDAFGFVYVCIKDNNNAFLSAIQLKSLALDVQSEANVVLTPHENVGGEGAPTCPHLTYKAKGLLAGDSAVHVIAPHRGKAAGIKSNLHTIHVSLF
jgi:hypothetical protein